ncbi:MAG: hydroxymethylglutaryl-CoA lyase [Candidatus Melainabacteria bacterium]|nr:hydroxymethylglutaryl-CoA lyase [Candidatus Melainabacteria bacterium]MBI3309576.1 hydroxymethylglutaryl-CoA lyase [Candidatus Melainabacteria bacterium]
MKTYPMQVKIVEVGPRDGLQNEKGVVPTNGKIEYINKLSKSGLKFIEVTSFVNPKNVPQLYDASDVVKALNLDKDIVYSALIPNMKGLDRALEAGIKHVAIFTAASETFNKKNINMTISESLSVFNDVIKVVLTKGITIRGYISTCFVCPYEGNIKKEKVLDVANALLDIGVEEISIGDTIGAAVPKDVYSTVGNLLNSIPKEKIALHFHDTYGTALTNVLTGLELGISTYDSSSGGLGGCPYAPGASGNLATEDLVYFLEKMGIKTGVDLEKLAEASLFMQGVLGHPLPSKQLARILSTRQKISN